MRTIFVSGPYRADTKAGIRQNIKRARTAAQMLWLDGWAVFCPHMNSALLEGPNQIYLDGDLEILKHCDAVFMLEGWAESKGSVVEHRFAQDKGLEIHYQTYYKHSVKSWFFGYMD